MNQTSCSRSEVRMGREARAKGSPKRAPLLVSPLEHPSYRRIASVGLEAPIAASAGRRPSLNAVPRRKTLSERSRCFSPNRNPSSTRRLASSLRSRTCSLSRRPFTRVICGHCSREPRLCFHSAVPRPDGPSTVGDSIGSTKGCAPPGDHRPQRPNRLLRSNPFAGRCHAELRFSSYYFDRLFTWPADQPRHATQRL